MADPNKLSQAIIARQQLNAHKRTVAKAIGSRERRLNQTIDALARRDMGIPELPLTGAPTEILSPEVTDLIANPVKGL